MKGVKLFFDLDGTLIDSTRRLYHLFQELVPASSLSYEEYWQQKRSGKTHHNILTDQFGYSQQDTVDFEEQWMPAIEDERFLKYDQPFAGVTQYLELLKADHDLYIITARQSEPAAKKQIASFSWDFLTGVFVAKSAKEKAALISGTGELSFHDWIIGDTEREIETGKELGIKTAAVLSGFRSKALLEKYHPDQIADKVTDLKL